MKPCSKCKKSLPFSYFYKDKRTPTGLYSACRKCHFLGRKKQTPKKSTGGARRVRELRYNLRHNPTPFCAAILAYYSVRSRIGRKHYKNTRCEINRSILEAFFTENWDTYLEIHKEWVKSGFQRRFYPSLDRINTNGHYTPSNIQILPLGKNVSKDNLGRKLSLKHRQKLSKARYAYNARQRLLTETPKPYVNKNRRSKDCRGGSTYHRTITVR